MDRVVTSLLVIDEQGNVEEQEAVSLTGKHGVGPYSVP